MLHPDLPLHDDIVELQQSNQARLEQVNRQGLAIGANREGAILELLLDETLGQTSGRRGAWELRWQQDIAANLDEAEAELRRQQLTRP